MEFNFFPHKIFYQLVFCLAQKLGTFFMCHPGIIQCWRKYLHSASNVNCRGRCALLVLWTCWLVAWLWRIFSRTWVTRKRVHEMDHIAAFIALLHGW